MNPANPNPKGNGGYERPGARFRCGRGACWGKPCDAGPTHERAAEAAMSDGLRQAIECTQAVIISPSNPFVSIDPILALPRIVNALTTLPVVAISPIVGGRALKGPLAKMMSELGVEPSALGVARHYGDVVDGWIIDSLDRDPASV